MAPWNPDVQKTQDPNYLGYSHPISPIPADTSFGSALKGFGDTIEAGFKGADEIVKSIIDKAVYQKVDEKREAFTGNLEEIAGIPSNLRVADYQPDRNVLPGQTPDVPEALQGIERSVGNLTTGSKMSPALKTYYTGRLDVIAKDLRQQYPGYRDYIDKKIESVTGENPANAMIKDLMQMINQQGEGNKSNLEKARSYLEVRSGEMGGPDDKVSAVYFMAKINAGVYPDPLTAVMSWSIKRDSTKASQKAVVDAWHAEEADNNVHKLSAGKTISDMAAKQQSLVWSESLGSIPGMSVKTLDEFVAAADRGEQPMNSDQALALGYALRAKIAAATNTLRVATAARGGPRNESLRGVYGDEEADKRIAGGFSMLHDLSERLIGSQGKDLSILGRSAKHIDAVTSDSRSSLLDDPEIRSKILTLDAAKTYGGPQVAQYIAAQQLGQGFAKELTVYFDHQRAKLIMPSADPNNPYTIKDAIIDAKNKGIGIIKNPDDPTARPNAKAERAYYDRMLEVPGKVLADPKITDALKIISAKAAYDPKNLGLISEFAVGKDQTRAYEVLTSKPAVDNLYRLGQRDPEVWRTAKNWADLSFRNELFTTEIRDISKFVTTPNIKVAYITGIPGQAPRFYAYDTQQGAGTQDAFEAAAARTRGRVQNTYLKQVNESLDRLNTGIAGMHNFISAEKGDTDAYVIQTLTNAGLDPTKTVGIPGEIMKAILAGRTPVKDTFGNKNTNKNQDRAP